MGKLLVTVQSAYCPAVVNMQIGKPLHSTWVDRLHKRANTHTIVVTMVRSTELWFVHILRARGAQHHDGVHGGVHRQQHDGDL